MHGSTRSTVSKRRVGPWPSCTDCGARRSATSTSAHGRATGQTRTGTRRPSSARPIPGYPDERWLDIRRIGRLAPILRKRFDICKRKRFDAVEPDNLAGYENRSGFPLSAADQLRFNRWVAREVHRRGMSVALKNDPEQASRLVADFDFAVVEECFAYDECEKFSPFVEAGKAIFSAEYEGSPSDFCPRARALRFSTIEKGYDLFARPWRPCA